MKESSLVLLGGPRAPFNAQELQDIRRYVEEGGRAIIMMAEGGETKAATNINAMLEQVGISVNNDCVIRKTFHKYLHPKEAFIGNGCLNDELVKAAHGKHTKEEDGNKPGKYSKKYRDTKDELEHRDENGGLKFVYPYGCTINVRKPAQSLLSSGPISFPANRPIAGFYTSPRKGKLVVIGSIQFFSDEFFEKEDNQKIQEAVFGWLLNDICQLEGHIKNEPDLSEYHHVPDITALADRLRSCLQESDELPKDFTTLFTERLFKFDTDLIPETLELYKQVGVKHEPLTLIPPKFETPMPALQAAVFPPALKELPPPSLDLYDLDEQFASEKIKMA